MTRPVTRVDRRTADRARRVAVASAGDLRAQLDAAFDAFRARLADLTRRGDTDPTAAATARDATGDMTEALLTASEKL